VVSSNNESVVKIDPATGVVTAVGRGSAKIYATAIDGSGKTDYYEIRVK
jgi:uncharacterized protein YjdB